MAQATPDKHEVEQWQEKVDRARKASEAMDAFLASNGRTRVKVARDGCCLFRAFAAHVYGTQSAHTKVRRECVQYLRDHRSDFEPFLDVAFDKYVESMAQPHVWGGEIEVSAMTRMYNLEVTVLRELPHPQVDEQYYPLATSPSNILAKSRRLELCYAGEDHYDYVLWQKHADLITQAQGVLYSILHDRLSVKTSPKCHPGESFYHVEYEAWLGGYGVKKTGTPAPHNRWRAGESCLALCHEDNRTYLCRVVGVDGGMCQVEVTAGDRRGHHFAAPASALRRTAASLGDGYYSKAENVPDAQDPYARLAHNSSATKKKRGKRKSGRQQRQQLDFTAVDKDKLLAEQLQRQATVSTGKESDSVQAVRFAAPALEPSGKSAPAGEPGVWGQKRDWSKILTSKRADSNQVSSEQNSESSQLSSANGISDGKRAGVSDGRSQADQATADETKDKPQAVTSSVPSAIAATSVLQLSTAVRQKVAQASDIDALQVGFGVDLDSDRESAIPTEQSVAKPAAQEKGNDTKDVAADKSHHNGSENGSSASDVSFMQDPGVAQETSKETMQTVPKDNHGKSFTSTNSTSRQQDVGLAGSHGRQHHHPPTHSQHERQQQQYAWMPHPSYAQPGYEYAPAFPAQQQHMPVLTSMPAAQAHHHHHHHTYGVPYVQPNYASHGYYGASPYGPPQPPFSVSAPAGGPVIAHPTQMHWQGRPMPPAMMGQDFRPPPSAGRGRWPGI